MARTDSKQTDVPRNIIIPGDCVEVLSSFPDRCVDLIFADPPYNLQLQNELYRPNLTKVDAVDDEWDFFTSFNEYDAFTEKWLRACQRVLSDQGTIWVIGTYHNIHRIGKIMMDLGFWFLNDVTWVKTNPMPNFKGTRFTNATETLIWAKKSFEQKKYSFNHHAMKALNEDKQMRSEWYIPLCRGEERIKVNGKKAHSTQKPEALLYRVIMSASNPGDLVLDPFVGAGTTAAVATKLRRDYIGIEINKSYVNIAKKRLDKISPTLFDDTLLVTKSKRSAPRVPFGTLVEMRYISVGENLYSRNKKYSATVKANSHLLFKNFEGSIHKVGAHVQNAPACNGWDFWYVERKGSLVLIDRLRQKYLEQSGINKITGVH